MHKETIQQLKKLKAIEPNSAFRAKSRTLFFDAAEKKSRFSFFLSPFFASGLAVLFVSVLSIGVLTFIHRSRNISLIHTEEINKEFNDLTINIELQKIEYANITDEFVVSAFPDGISTGNEYISNPKIDQLLHRATF